MYTLVRTYAHTRVCNVSQRQHFPGHRLKFRWQVTKPVCPPASSTLRGRQLAFPKHHFPGEPSQTHPRGETRPFQPTPWPGPPSPASGPPFRKPSLWGCHLRRLLLALRDEDTHTYPPPVHRPSPQPPRPPAAAAAWPVGTGDLESYAGRSGRAAAPCFWHS